jgi:hemerythrin-like domain-containing protein
MTDIAGSSNTFRTRYRADHDELEAGFARLLVAFETNDRDAVAKLWNDLDERLVRHLEAEERLLIPQLFLSSPREARTILEEHRHIRSRLIELGCGVDLHVIRVEAARGFVEELRAHSRHEDEALYCWADDHLDAGEQGALVAALGLPLPKDDAA